MWTKRRKRVGWEKKRGAFGNSKRLEINKQLWPWMNSLRSFVITSSYLPFFFFNVPTFPFVSCIPTATGGSLSALSLNDSGQSSESRWPSVIIRRFAVGSIWPEKERSDKLATIDRFLNQYMLPLSPLSVLWSSVRFYFLKRKLKSHCLLSIKNMAPLVSHVSLIKGTQNDETEKALISFLLHLVQFFFLSFWSFEQVLSLHPSGISLPVKYLGVDLPSPL